MAELILVEGLVKKFGDTTALAGVDLSVAEGTVLGLLGPTVRARRRLSASSPPCSTPTPGGPKSPGSTWPAKPKRYVRSSG
jgi:hypothetical protein